MIRTAEEILGSNKTGGRSFNVLKAMEEYADQFKLKWIPVTEPPEPGDLCVIKKGKSIALGRYSSGEKLFFVVSSTGQTIEYIGITHYCKLPEL